MLNRDIKAKTSQSQTRPTWSGEIASEVVIGAESERFDHRKGVEASRNGVVGEGMLVRDCGGLELRGEDLAEVAEGVERGHRARGDCAVELMLSLPRQGGAGSGGKGERRDQDFASDAEQLLTVGSSNVGRLA